MASPREYFMPGSSFWLRFCSMESIMGYSSLERLLAVLKQPEPSMAFNSLAIFLCNGQHPTSDGLTTLNLVAPAAYKS
jgi:hypothetical protein